jgi:hypothetical protein
MTEHLYIVRLLKAFFKLLLRSAFLQTFSQKVYM